MSGLISYLSTDKPPVTIPVDANHGLPISYPGAAQTATKTITFTGAAGLGAVGAVPIFTVTGTVTIWYFVPTCLVTLVSAGGGTLTLGVTGNTGLFISAATTATAITTAAPLWLSSTPATGGSQIPVAMKDVAVVANILATVATASITAGAIRFDCIFEAQSAGATVV